MWRHLLLFEDVRSYSKARATTMAEWEEQQSGWTLVCCILCFTGQGWSILETLEGTWVNEVFSCWLRQPQSQINIMTLASGVLASSQEGTVRGEEGGIIHTAAFLFSLLSCSLPAPNWIMQSLWRRYFVCLYTHSRLMWNWESRTNRKPWGFHYLLRYEM